MVKNVKVWYMFELWHVVVLWPHIHVHEQWQYASLPKQGWQRCWATSPSTTHQKIIHTDTNSISITLLSVPTVRCSHLQAQCMCRWHGTETRQTSHVVYSPKHDRSENCTQFLTTSLHLKMHFESRRIDPVCMQYRLCIVYPQTMTSHLKHSTFTSCYTSLKVVSCEAVSYTHLTLPTICSV